MSTEYQVWDHGTLVERTSSAAAAWNERDARRERYKPEHRHGVVVMEAHVVEALPVIRIVWTVDDVRDIAVDNDVDADLAIDRAYEWGKCIEETASSLCSEQLENAVLGGQP